MYYKRKAYGGTNQPIFLNRKVNGKEIMTSHQNTVTLSHSLSQLLCSISAKSMFSDVLIIVI